VSPTAASALRGPSDLAFEVRDFMTEGGQPIRDLGAWTAQIDALRAIVQSGATALVTGEASFADPAAARAWHELALASFLLVTDGSARLHLATDRAADLSTLDTPQNRGRLGRATAPAEELGGLHVRRFALGLVVVNPTDTPRAIELPHGNYRTLQNKLVSGRLIVGPFSGVSLLTVKGS
jgi:hypothetical protein